MKTLSLKILLFTFFAALTTANYVKAAQTLLWSDEFNGTSLNTNYWDIWDKADGSDSWHAPKNVSVANGMLIIQNHEELYNGVHWTGGGISTKQVSGVYHPKYGYIEARVRFTVNQCYVWGAWWADGANSTTGVKQWPPEFDIMEYYGGPQNSPWFHYYSGSWTGHSLGVSDESQWHTYGMYWDANTNPISYRDGIRQYQTSDNSSVKNIGLLLQISCSPSSKVRYSGCPLGDMQVDYVRFYDVAPDMTGGGGGGIVSGGIYRLAPKIASSKALDASGTGDGSQMQIWDWFATSNQEYQITDVGGGYYKLVPQSATTKALDVNAAGSADGTKIQIWGDNGTSAQKWQIVDMGGGFYKLQPQCASGSCLDVKSSGTANGTIVQLYHDNGTDAQRWSLQKQ